MGWGNDLPPWIAQWTRGGKSAARPLAAARGGLRRGRRRHPARRESVESGHRSGFHGCPRLRVSKGLSRQGLRTRFAPHVRQGVLRRLLRRLPRSGGRRRRLPRPRRQAHASAGCRVPATSTGGGRSRRADRTARALPRIDAAARRSALSLPPHPPPAMRTGRSASARPAGDSAISFRGACTGSHVAQFFCETGRSNPPGSTRIRAASRTP